ncbi:protein kinase [Streptomyces sp. H10-C2]|uniref:serine/threonine protein kinase n=1 Tax=unclassified Streptomyces TaxID=2593676 RepID=UPI0024B9B561|nr:MULTISPECIES: protein kinase [unclassified Streptomyces]MDJ0340234.1 protein kinase [Streptomyces sp. PH10-H1]MDJ0368317.1 protein kinase [Streptomyces sp. H10-C2]
MGEVFAGRYELVDPIGRGGAGAVWRSWDHRRGRYVAAKVLQQSDAHALLRFVREQAMRIDHPHVLAPASWAADDDKVLFTMDLVRGGSLSHLIGDYGPLPPRFVCALLDQLLSGLTAVHAEGVVHRDIKPANILLEATGTGLPHLRLSDFGIAMRKGEPRLTEANYIVGTPGYFAPEQMLGAEPDFPADLYAVGLVALYLLSGKKPDAQAILERYLNEGVPRAPQGVPEPMWQVIGNLLQPDPDARFRTATGARKALSAAVELLSAPGLDDEPVEVFDQIGPLPEGFDARGPRRTPRQVRPEPTSSFRLPPPRMSPQTPAPTPGQPWGMTPEPDQPQQPAYGYPQTGIQAPPLPEQPTTPPTTPPTPEQNPYATAVAAQSPIQAQGPLHAHGPTPTGTHRPDEIRPEATRPYTAAVPSTAGAAAPPPARRPGPPAKLVVPILIVAALCFAVGIWALAAA